MNILATTWLPVICSNGEAKTISLADIGDPKITNLNLPRADFQGAAYQLIVGVLQTVLAPEDSDDWLDKFEEPPSPEEFSKAFSQIEHAFNLIGEKPESPLFMQDFDPLESAKPSAATSLLIEAPGDNGIKLNTDFFIKRGFVEQMSLPMAALALFTLQINAPSGGQGHRTGLRGGGPLSTLVLSNQPDACLWQKLWLNVMSKEWLADNSKADWTNPDFSDGSVFPWLAPTVTSEKKAVILPTDVHPLHRYWAMPRRIRLNIEDRSGSCDISGEAAAQLVSSYRTQNYGNNYSGDWRTHPFTPYRGDPKKPDDEYLSIKGQPGGITYKQWEILRFARPDSQAHNSALVVSHMHQLSEYLDDDLKAQLRLWSFAYDMDNMKPRGFYSTEMPFAAMPAGLEEDFFSEVSALQTLAHDMGKQVRTQVKRAWFKRSDDAKGDFSFIDLMFWQRTEPVFFQAVSSLADQASAKPDELILTPEMAKRWLLAMQAISLEIFDELVLSSEPEPREMSEKIEARNILRGWLYRSKKPIQQFKTDYKIVSEQTQGVSA